MKTAIVEELANSGVYINLCGAGAITCVNEEICEDEVIAVLEHEFCISDDLGL